MNEVPINKPIPQKPGVYFFKDQSGKVIYIGKAKNLKNRVKSYFLKRDTLGPKTQSMIDEAKKLDLLIVESELEALILEAELIRKNQPKYNIDWKDGKAYPLIKITVKEEYPRVLTVRREENDKALYFGPFPNVNNMRLVLKLGRRLFPYVSVASHPKNYCFYHHLNLCPCPMVEGGRKEKVLYKENIKSLILFLKGKKRSLFKKLQNEMEHFSEEENFEEAEMVKKQILALENITQPQRLPGAYIDNPNLLEDEREEETNDLARHLKEKANFRENFLPLTIEAYDISDISGQSAVGSLVRFEKGEPNKKLYRRFKIKMEAKPNDVGMLEEVLKRRLVHEEWPYPELFLIDGGKTQVGKIYGLLQEEKIDVPVIGLAKRVEEIVVPQKHGEETSFISLQLNDSPALNLLKRLRDEAHRFAQNYHHFLTIKKITKPVNLPTVNQSSLRK